jgi:hypothetical protein
MDVKTIARLARLSTRKVRYVLDQRLLPGLRGRPQKGLAGRPRSFTDLEGYLIACAGLLHAGGVQRGTVAGVLAALARMPWPPWPGAVPPPGPAEQALPQPRTAAEALYWPCGGPLAVLVGDAVNLRLRARGADTGWLEPRSLARLEAAYRPRVTIRLDLGPLRAEFDRAGAE